MSTDAQAADHRAVRPKRLAVSGGSISYLSDGSGPPLLFLHGGGGAGAWHDAHAIFPRSRSGDDRAHPGPDAGPTGVSEHGRAPIVPEPRVDR